jgi:hypothetical protein
MAMPSLLVICQPSRVMVAAVVLYNSIHSSAYEAAVPIHATSLMMTSRVASVVAGNAACTVAREVGASSILRAIQINKNPPTKANIIRHPRGRIFSLLFSLIDLIDDILRGVVV